jgi:hypothetical protein
VSEKKELDFLYNEGMNELGGRVTELALEGLRRGKLANSA